MASKRRRPTKAEKELQERCEELQRRLDGHFKLRETEVACAKENREKQFALIENLEKELNREREEHRDLRFATRAEIEKLTRQRDEAQTALTRLCIKHEQLGRAFQATAKVIAE